ncbi:MAG: DEAD/DEAH box helicase [Actinomycetota bacterium]|nr:MAG: DEAD/DEAH box helicase [Actinomycetota bacterium]
MAAASHATGGPAAGRRTANAPAAGRRRTLRSTLLWSPGPHGSTGRVREGPTNVAAGAPGLRSRGGPGACAPTRAPEPTLTSTTAPDSDTAPDTSTAADSGIPADASAPDSGTPAESDAARSGPGPTFAELGAHPDIVAALAEAGIVHAFPIQEMTLGLALDGHDLIGQAKTGTGKTLGFGVPILQRVVTVTDPGYDDLPADVAGKPQALIVVPTRELGVQVAGDLARAGSKRGVRVLTVYGGRAYEPQVEALKNGVDVVVGTPGRLIDLAQQRHLDLSKVKILVLDEADEMLDMGFLPDVERIVAQLPVARQTMLFSATMPGQIVNLARRYMDRPTHIRAADPGDDRATVDAIEQHVWRAHPMDKVELLSRVLQAEGRGLTMIFCRTKRRAQKVADELSERGFAAAAVHGDLGQGAREQALRAFRNGKVDVLVATDVAARGIDVEAVTHVVNYECPDDEKTYLHRIGRTGRAGASGVAVTLVDWEDVARWQMIDRILGLPFAEPLETYSSSPHIYTGLGIPAGVSGTLPRANRTRAGLQAEAVEDLGETGKAPRSRHDRDRGRAPRPSRDSGRASGSAEPTPREGTDGDRPARRPRRRTRTVLAGGVTTADAPDAAPAAQPDTTGELHTAAAPDGDQPTAASGPARRRRRRGGRGRGTAGTGAATDTPASPATDG